MTETAEDDLKRRQVVWSVGALDQLEAIRGYIELHSPRGAPRVFAQLVAAGDSLGVLPERGRPVSANYRELLAVSPYLIRYRIEPDRVVITRLRHGRRRPLA